MSFAIAVGIVSVVSGGGLYIGREYGTYAIEQCVALIGNNPFLQAVFIPSLLGALLYVLQVVGTSVYTNYISPYLYSFITIGSTETECFEALLDFVQDQQLLKANHLMACKKKRTMTWKERMQEYVSGEKPATEIAYRPANTGGVTTMEYRGRVIYISRKLGETVTVGWERQAIQMETMTLSVSGTDTSILQDLIATAISRTATNQSEELSIYVVATGWPEGWEKVLSKKPRSLDSVVLDHDLSNDLVEDARQFLSSGQWYADLGIPYRRGYLLHGPPGCGKTSFCQALAGALHLDVCILSLSNKGLDDNSLNRNLREAPRRSIVVLEDVDAVFTHREMKSRGGESSTGVSFSGLLNAIDGVASQVYNDSPLLCIR